MVHLTIWQQLPAGKCAILSVAFLLLSYRILDGGKVLYIIGANVLSNLIDTRHTKKVQFVTY